MIKVRFIMLQVTLSSRIAEDSRRVKQGDNRTAEDSRDSLLRLSIRRALIYAFSAFHQLYPDMVRAFDKSGPQPPAC